MKKVTVSGNEQAVYHKVVWRYYRCVYRQSCVGAGYASKFDHRFFRASDERLGEIMSPIVEIGSFHGSRILEASVSLPLRGQCL